MASWLQGKIVEKRQWHSDLFSLKISTIPLKFNAGQFIRVGLDVDDKLLARPYSLVNTPEDSLLEIHFNTVENGQLSPRLADLAVGDGIQVSDRIGGLLTLDEIPDVANLWFIATGTGVGPFLSILKTPEPWHRFEKIVLCYSVKTLDKQAYRGDFESLQALHPDQFYFVPFVTRELTREVNGDASYEPTHEATHEKMAETIRTRITTSIENGDLEKRVNLSLSTGSNHFMLCGNSKMIGDVCTLLLDRGLRRHSRREPGHIATEKYY